MGNGVRVVVVDDHSLFRAGVIQTLEMDKDIKVVGQGANGTEALELVMAHSPDVVLLDISMPGNGIEAAAAVARVPSPPKVMMLTISEDDDDIKRALEVGALGYVLKGVGAAELISAVRDVASGESFVSPNLALRLLASVRAEAKQSLLSSLTEMEERTLRLASTGLSNREVGVRLGIVEKTVKYHMNKILKKLKVRNRLEAALMARKEWGDDCANSLLAETSDAG